MRQLETVRLLYKFNNLRQKQGMSIGEFDDPHCFQSTHFSTSTMNCSSFAFLFFSADKAPQGKQSAFIAIGEDDSQDEEAIYDACFMMKETVFFGKTEVLLDNQVSRSIFNNSDLLSDIQYENPFFVGGIDGTSRGLKKIHRVFSPQRLATYLLCRKLL